MFEFTFIYSGVMYCTIQNASDFVKNLCTYKNAIERNTLITNKGAGYDYKKSAGCDVRDLPILEKAIITVNDNMFNLEGVVNYNGKEYKVVTDDNGNITDASHPIEVEQAMVIEEPTSTPMPTPTPASVPATAPVLGEVKSQPIPTQHATVNMTSTQYFENVRRNPIIPKHGVFFGKANVRNDTVVFGGTSNNAKGFYGGDAMYKRKEQPAPIVQKPVQKPVQQQKPVPQPVPQPVPVSQPVLQPQQKPTVDDILPIKLPEEIAAKEQMHIDQYTDTDSSERDTVFESFSAEVQAVIEDIPRACLGPINEFVTAFNDIDELQRVGTMYCIDHRWNKCGDWYCIDIVNEASRLFYNAKTKSITNIPIDNLRRWRYILQKGE